VLQVSRWAMSFDRDKIARYVVILVAHLEAVVQDAAHGETGAE
jgi:hypothetical protein